MSQRGLYRIFCFFFFQAEDGIRDYKVTGVQTCALPISRWRRGRHDARLLALMRMAVGGMTREQIARELDPALPQEEREALLDDVFGRPRSEERRVGKEGRSRWSPDH